MLMDGEQLQRLRVGRQGGNLFYPPIDGCMDASELEESRIARILHGNAVLGAQKSTQDWQILPVTANGECFLRAIAAELQNDILIADCRLLYVLALECLIMYKDMVKHLLGEEDAIRRARRACLAGMEVYHDHIAHLDEFDIYCLDKFEGLITCEAGLSDRHWCDFLEIHTLLQRFNASILIISATQDAQNKSFVEGEWRDDVSIQEPTMEMVRRSDFLLVHWDEPSFAHYDPVFDVRTNLAWQASQRIRDTYMEAVRGSTLCRTYIAGNMNDIRQCALRDLRQAAPAHQPRAGAFDDGGTDICTSSVTDSSVGGQTMQEDNASADGCSEPSRELSDDFDPHIPEETFHLKTSDRRRHDFSPGAEVEEYYASVFEYANAGEDPMEDATETSMEKEETPEEGSDPNPLEAIRFEPRVDYFEPSAEEIAEYKASLYEYFFDDPEISDPSPPEETRFEPRGDYFEPTAEEIAEYKASLYADCFEGADPREDATETSSSEIEAESNASASELSERGEEENALIVGVEQHKDWETLEDAELARIERLAHHLREKPLLPPMPEQPMESWTDVKSGVNFPVCHCAFKGCAWVSERLPCEFRSCNKSLRRAHNGVWCKVPERAEVSPGMYACCSEEACLKEHIMCCHLDVLISSCSQAAVAQDSYDYYLEAIAYQEQQHIPTIGPSVDRRTFKHVRDDMSEEAVQGLICMCCARIRRSCNTTNSEIARVECGEYFESLKAVSFLRNWDFIEYMNMYGKTDALRGHPHLQNDCWLWRRRLLCSDFQNRVIICCPEDVSCEEDHDRMFLCQACTFPLCRECHIVSKRTQAASVGIPAALANDNFIGFPSDVIYKYKARWIECVAASPVFTSLITYYVEGDRGHLLDERQHHPRQAYAVRGNVYSFHMPWEAIMEKLGKVTELNAMEALPHDEHVLAQVVLFSLRVGDVAELNKWLPMARLRPHVVLKLLFSLVDAHFPFCKGSRNAHQLKTRFAALVDERYPDAEKHLPENEREGYIPAAVAAEIRKAMRPPPCDKDSGVFNKHATPAIAPEGLGVVLEELRPSSLFPDRSSTNIVERNAQEVLALGKYNFRLKVETGTKFEISQWNAGYVSLAWPFSFPRAVSGADFPNAPRLRRHEEAPIFEPWDFSRSLASRVEACIRNDWILVPGVRNLTSKWDALCGDAPACRHPVDLQKPGNIHAAELTDATGKLYKKLQSGKWFDGHKRRKINFDVSKLPYAVDLSVEEKRLVKDLTFLTSKLPGTQEIRLRMGHSLFGARVEFGDPLFITISPSARHSGMCIRLSRYRDCDPSLFYDSDDRPGLRPWHEVQRPNIWGSNADNTVVIDVPEYDIRKKMTARDPWAVIQNFLHSLKGMLPRLLGMRMCPECPRCNAGDAPCQNKFGHNMMPMGGLLALAQGSGGCVEYQRNSNPHFHGNVHIASAYQHKTLQEIAGMIEDALLSLESITAYQSWMCREEHFDQEAHYEHIDALEQHWKENNKARENDGLCQLPTYIRDDGQSSLWSSSEPLTMPEALEDAANFTRSYFKDAQYVFSRCHHHWHPVNPRTHQRMPIAGCRSKRDINICKGRYPLTKRLNLIPKVICKGNCRKHDLRVSGRRNALGMLLGRRGCEWFSGTTPGFAVLFRENTHTAPNYRVPLSRKTHDPECSADCLDATTIKRMMACAQRAQRNTTGYFTGYIQKRQPVGKFELRQATLNLQYLAKAIRTRSNKEQYHRVANRLLGDLEYRGHVRPATEEFNLAGNHRPEDLMNAEFIRTFMSQSFCGGYLLNRLKYEKGTQGTNYTVVSKVPLPHKFAKKKTTMTIAFEEVYGFRGNHPCLYYLSPWEFTKWWIHEALLQPSAYEAAKEPPRTEWTLEGLQYREKTMHDPGAAAPEPGVHYIVLEPQIGTPSEHAGLTPYVVFPDDEETYNLRHRFILVRRRPPMVPSPSGTPMPRAKMPEEERCRLLSVYLRPWVLHRKYASPHVPHLVDLDRPVSRVLNHPRIMQRLRKKTSVIPRSYAQAWQDYQTTHVVSQHAARTIKNFLLTQMPESLEADEEEDDPEKGTRAWDPIDTSWVSKDEIQEVLQRGQILQNDGKTRKSNMRKEKFSAEVQTALNVSHRLWGAATNPDDAPVSKAGSLHLESTPVEASETKSLQRKKKQPRTETTALVYEGLTRSSANIWLRILCTPSAIATIKKKIPSDEQKNILQEIIDRTLQEQYDERSGMQFRSEPLRFMLHGVPGAGKSETLKWVRSFFENVCHFTHGVEFVFLTSQNTMAALIEGFTLHSFGDVAFHQASGKMANVRKNADVQDMSKHFLRFERLRWILIDEASTAAVEVLATFEQHVRTAIREQHSWALRGHDDVRGWGGMNLGFCGDMWQFRPVRATAIFDNPFTSKGLSAVDNILSMFWTKGPNAVTKIFELTQERRCKDAWLSYFLKGARHGTLDHEIYCFTHGLPTLHAGSWMPTTADVLCGLDACRQLPNVWDQHLRIRPNSTWEERRSQECDICASQRKRRCRVVGSSDLSPDMNDVHFVDAPYIHPFNAPKYHASQLRAVNFAHRKHCLLLWLVAEDKPIFHDFECLTAEEKQAKKHIWLTKHDQETSGIMGLQPLAKDMPLRITQTLMQNKIKRFFKNSRVYLHGWHLHSVDEERLQTCTDHELILQHMPEKLFVRVPEATWIEDAALGPGVAAINPVVVTWALDKQWQVLVKRKGFPIASDFSGTAHSFAGANLPAALIDCLSWDHEPNQPDQLTGYMCFSRVETIADICVVQPFPPTLFSQGDLPGPELLLKFQKGAVAQEQLEEAWRSRTKKRRAGKTTWPEDMPLYCRGCSMKQGKDVYRALKDFPDHGAKHRWDRIVSLGMERFCTACSKERIKKAGAQGAAKGQEFGALGKESGSLGGTPADHITCVACGRELPTDAFDPDQLSTWRKHFNTARDATCTDCMDKQHNVITCVLCQKELPTDAFDAERLRTWRLQRTILTRAKCKVCTAKQITCTACKRTLSTDAFFIEKLTMWKKHRDTMKRAICTACAPEQNARLMPTKPTWTQRTYRCSQCAREQPPQNFDIVALRGLESRDELFLATCGKCANAEDHTERGPPMKCNLCGKTKPRTAFSVAKQRTKNTDRVRCIDCDFPACEKCGKVPDAPKTKPYTCHKCNYPPCQCGTERPQKNKYHVSIKPKWTCSKCLALS